LCAVIGADFIIAAEDAGECRVAQCRTFKELGKVYILSIELGRYSQESECIKQFFHEADFFQALNLD
jgi:hypothetical protein